MFKIIIMIKFLFIFFCINLNSSDHILDVIKHHSIVPDNLASKILMGASLAGICYIKRKP